MIKMTYNFVKSLNKKIFFFKDKPPIPHIVFIFQKINIFVDYEFSEKFDLKSLYPLLTIFFAKVFFDSKNINF